MSKSQFASLAAFHGVKAGYSGKEKKMMVSGNEPDVKKFLRLMNLKGKKSFTFAFGQG